MSESPLLVFAAELSMAVAQATSSSLSGTAVDPQGAAGARNLRIMQIVGRFNF